MHGLCQQGRGKEHPIDVKTLVVSEKAQNYRAVMKVWMRRIRTNRGFEKLMRPKSSAKAICRRAKYLFSPR